MPYAAGKWKNDYKKRGDDKRYIIRGVKLSGCSQCGEKDFRCLDMHHRDPLEKKFSLSVGNWSRSMASWLKEMEKCDVLCANCHRKLHYK